MSKGRGSYKKRRQIYAELAAYQKECFLCLEELDFLITDQRDKRYVVIDEYVPVSKGGDPNDINNCNLVHSGCNSRKGNRILQRGAFAKATKQGVAPTPSRNWNDILL